MTNEELQTLIKNACKAAGIEYSHAGGYRVIGIGETGMKVMEKFNPADDDGDSRVLQVACKIDLFFNHDMHKNGHEVVTAFHDGERGHSHSEPLGTHPLQAARMAVLRCAGMIGEAMK